ncbi:MAG: stalk domain-containing protein [Caldisericia bacterium]|nr:stalk domain-containing protein [Caldisericia bacterium]MDD4614607.1 stalk domain-containing protein [Caldisericia bacterium]
MKLLFISLIISMLLFLQPTLGFPTRLPPTECASHTLFPDLNGIVEPGEYEASFFNTPQDWSFHYTIVNETLKGGIIADTKGWCAIGFDPETKMKGADIIQGWMVDEKPFATDSYGTKEFGPHPFDTDLGGTNNIQYFALSYQNDKIHFEFRRKLDTGDSFDKLFPIQGELPILWAYGSLSNHSSIHTKRGYGLLQNIEESIRTTPTIAMKTVHESLSTYQILDISDQYSYLHIKNSIHCPPQDLLDNVSILDHTKPTVVYGNTQDDLLKFTNDLLFHDFRVVYTLDGSLNDWISKGYPVEKGSAKSIIMKFYIGLQEYFVNKKKILMDVAPVLLQNRTCLPIVYVVQPLHGTIQWFPETKKIVIQLESTQIECWIGKSNAIVNGEDRWIDPDNHEVVPVLLPPGRTFVPVRFVAESLGCEVLWNASLQEITIQYALE